MIKYSLLGPEYMNEMAAEDNNDDEDGGEDQEDEEMGKWKCSCGIFFSYPETFC